MFNVRRRLAGVARLSALIRLRPVAPVAVCWAALFVASPAGLAQSAATEAPLSPGWRQQSFAPASARSTPLTGDKAIEHLKAAGQYESLAAAITAPRYAVMPGRQIRNPKSEIRNLPPSGPKTPPTA